MFKRMFNECQNIEVNSHSWMIDWFIIASFMLCLRLWPYSSWIPSLQLFGLGDQITMMRWYRWNQQLGHNVLSSMGTNHLPFGKPRCPAYSQPLCAQMKKDFWCNKWLRPAWKSTYIAWWIAPWSIYKWWCCAEHTIEENYHYVIAPSLTCCLHENRPILLGWMSWKAVMNKVPSIR